MAKRKNSDIIETHNPWCECAQCQPRADHSSGAYRLPSTVEDAASSDSRGTDNAELTAGYVLKQIYHLTATVRKANRDYMPSASAAAATKKGDSKPLLKGSDVPKKMWNGFTIVVTEVREAPENWTGLFIIDFEPIAQLKDANGEPITAFPLNKTNTAAVAGMHGDDTDRWKKKKIPLVVAMSRNPQTGKPAASIMVNAE